MSIKKRLINGIGCLAALVCYFSFLTMLSYIQAPAFYRMKVNDEIYCEDFQVLSDTTGSVNIQEESISIFNWEDGLLSGCQTPVALDGISAIEVSLDIQCRHAEENTAVYLDLCGENYDNIEQEVQLQLEKGVENVSFFIEPGNNAPSEANLRIFTAAKTDIELYNFEAKIYSLESNGIVGLSGIIAGVSFVVTFLSIILSRKSRIS